MGTSTSASIRRRGQVRRIFDARVDREWARYGGDARRVLRRTLRTRYLESHLPRDIRVILELGSGPGRFTPDLRRIARERVIAVDLSRFSLIAGRRRARGKLDLAPADWIQAAGEHLPLAPGTVGAAVLLGNIVCFASSDGPRLLREVARVLTPKGVLVIDFASPAGALKEALSMASKGRILRQMLRRPKYYFLDQVLDAGFQPYAPRRMATWEFRFYTLAEALRLLRLCGFFPFDTMSIGPLSAIETRIAEKARREPRSWESLLRIEEKVGRRPGLMEGGHGFLVAAKRK